jgi:hypothetical protein
MLRFLISFYNKLIPNQPVWITILLGFLFRLEVPISRTTQYSPAQLIPNQPMWITILPYISFSAQDLPITILPYFSFPSQELPNILQLS